MYAEERFFYDGRRKYCKRCAEERKRDKDAERMKVKRTAARDERTKRIEFLEAQNVELKMKVDMLLDENAKLRNVIISQR